MFWAALRKRIRLASSPKVACNDKEQVVPMLERLATLPASLGQPKAVVADTGLYSAKNVQACEAHARCGA